MREAVATLDIEGRKEISATLPNGKGGSGFFNDNNINKRKGRGTDGTSCGSKLEKKRGDTQIQFLGKKKKKEKGAAPTLKQRHKKGRWGAGSLPLSKGVRQDNRSQAPKAVGGPTSRLNIPMTKEKDDSLDYTSLKEERSLVAKLSK